MKQFIFTIGLPGSGKTTFLKEKGYSDIISADDIKLTIEDPVPRQSEYGGNP